MKKIIFAAAVAAGFLAAPGNAGAQEISFNVFYSSLAPYGEWVNVGSYGMCWRPAGVPADWRPYTFGHWIWTDYGWTWVSNYRWGWAPFHYGRWVFDSSVGWVWIPGYVWAPAWVEWRWGGGYCGWAPLPPGFHFRVDVVVGPDDHDFGVGIRGWNFVNAREMGAPRYRFVGEGAVRETMARTRNVTRFRFTSGGVYQVGLPKDQVERVTRRRIETMNVVRVNNIGHERIVGSSIHIYSPVPLEPRVRNEQEVVRQQRVYQAPERIRGERSAPARPRREINQPRVKKEPESPRVEDRRESNVRPKRDAPARGREQPKQHDKNEKKDNGPGKRH